MFKDYVPAPPVPPSSPPFAAAAACARSERPSAMSMRMTGALARCRELLAILLSYLPLSHLTVLPRLVIRARGVPLARTAAQCETQLMITGNLP